MKRISVAAGTAGLAAVLAVMSCSDPVSSGCEVVTAGDTRIQITNATGSGLEADFTDFAFAAFMRPGACEIFGVPRVDVNLDFTLCNFVADNDCQPTSQTVSRSFTLTRDETLAVRIDQSLF